jgi:hypothetical protein
MQGVGPSLVVRSAGASDAPTIARLDAVVQGLHHEAFPDRFLEPDATRVEPVYRNALDGDGPPSAATCRAWLCVDDNDDAVGYVLAVLHERPENPFTKAHRWIELDR